MTHLFNEGPISEHAGYPSGLSLAKYESEYNLDKWKSISFKGQADRQCLLLAQNWRGKKTLQTSYFIGADWLEEESLAVYVEPKLNDASKKTDYFKMLFEGFENPDIASHIPDIFEIKLNQPLIKIPSKLDVLTPLLVIQYLYILRDIVRKGLKKAHQPKESNLSNRIKGKLLVGKQIKQNILKNQSLKNYCQFNAFSIDGPENRVLKKGLLFALRYIDTGALRAYKPNLEKLLRYIIPAFNEVGDIATTDGLKHFKISAFFQDYRQGVHLARMIFKRYGFNIDTIHTTKGDVLVPPFWIDMSKLYEIYVLAQLKKQNYGTQIKFQPHGKYGAPDFLLLQEEHKLVIDAKYKPYYTEKYVASDIRQLSGYARDEGILNALNIQQDIAKENVVGCLIIYPLTEASNNKSLTLTELKKDKIDQFYRFYKLAVELPSFTTHTG